MKVSDYKGYEIQYDPRRKKFTADVLDNDLEAATEPDLESLIDKTIKKSGLFPILAIYCSGQSVWYGKVTSYNPQGGRGWFVRDDGYREKPWNFRDYYLDTELNRSICEQVKTKRFAISCLQKEIAELVKGLEKPFVEHMASLKGD